MPPELLGDAAPVFIAPPSRMSSDALHIWTFLPGDESILSAAERMQATRMTSGPAREAFLSGRAGVRMAASRYCGRSPEDFEIRTNPEGKPFFHDCELSFNLSHSGGTVVAAFSTGPVGIDIETPGRQRDYLAIARRFFHPDEVGSLASEDDFLRLWTAKEAMLKLAGSGLAGGLDVARPGDGRVGELRGEPVYLRMFRIGIQTGAVASFRPFEVKGWFEI